MIERIFFTLLLIIIGPQAVAQTSPSCLPKQWGSTGSEYISGSIDGFNWVGWACTRRGGELKVEGFVWEQGYKLKQPDTTGMTTPNQVMRAFYMLNTAEGCTSPGCYSARSAMRAALGQ